MCSESQQNAPVYTKEERLKYLIKLSLWVVPSFIAAKIWFFPFLKSYLKIAHCVQYGSFTGTHVVFYGLFVGFPLLLVIIALAIAGKRNIHIMKIGQTPLPGEKVFIQTKYTYGFKAKLKAYIFFILVIFSIGLGVQGYFWANEIIMNSFSHQSIKTVNNT